MLSDTDKRQVYDTYGEEGLKGELGGLSWGAELGGLSWGAELGGLSWGAELGGLSWGAETVWGGVTKGHA